jgi:hypothetical protein
MAAPSTWNYGGLYFDAWLRLNHNSSLTITVHPVQIGAAVTDHAYRNQRRFSFDIGYSDTVASPIPGNSSRSINAYRILVDMQNSRKPQTLVSKYGSTENVLIESIDVTDDFRTKTALKATVTLVEIIQADARLQKLSLAPNATGSTNRGQVVARVLSPQEVVAARRNGIAL